MDAVAIIALIVIMLAGAVVAVSEVKDLW